MGFFGFGSTLIDAHTLPGQTEGLKGWLRRDGWAEGWVGGGMGGRRDGWFAKVDNRFGYEKWLQGGSIGLGFININDMYNNDVGKGVVYAYEAYEVK